MADSLGGREGIGLCQFSGTWTYCKMEYSAGPLTGTAKQVFSPCHGWTVSQHTVKFFTKQDQGTSVTVMGQPDVILDVTQTEIHVVLLTDLVSIL